MRVVPIILGSKVDLEHGRAVAKGLHELGIHSEIRVCSAHKSPRRLMEILDAYEADERSKVYVTIAGRSNALSAFVDAYVSNPVIACPPYSDRYGGADLYSSLRMPSGVAPAVVLEPAGAALCAAKIFAVTDPAMRLFIQQRHRAEAEKLDLDDRALREEG